MAINNLATVQRNDVKSTEYWSKRLLGMIKLEEQNFVFHKLGVMKDIPLNQGTTTFSMRRYNSLPVSSTGEVSGAKLTEGTPPTALKVEAQKVQGTVHQYGNYIEETDVVDAVHFDNIKREYQPELARVAAEIKERVTLESFTEASEYYAGGKTSDDTITAEDVLKLKDCRMAALTQKVYRRKGHPKFGGKPVLVCGAQVMQDLLDDSALLNNILVPGNDNSVMKNGSLESYKAYGMYFQETLICPVKANTSRVNVYTSYLIGADAYAVFNFKKTEWKETGFEASKSDPLGQKATIGFKMWAGAKVLDPINITAIKSASKYDIVPEFSTDNIGRTASQA